MPPPRPAETSRRLRDMPGMLVRLHGRHIQPSIRPLLGEIRPGPLFYRWAKKHVVDTVWNHRLPAADEDTRGRHALFGMLGEKDHAAAPTERRPPSTPQPSQLET